MNSGDRRPTHRQLEVLRAYVAAGSIAGAAYELGITESTARQHLSGLYRRTGCLNAAQAAYLLGEGSLAPARPLHRVPAAIRSEGAPASTARELRLGPS